MSKRVFLWSGLALVIPALAGAARAADTLESVEKKLAEKSSKIKSLTAKMSMTTSITRNESSSQVESTGTHEFTRQGGKALSRTHMNVKRISNIAGKEILSEFSVLTIVNGDVMYTLRDQRGRTKALKTAAGGFQTADGWAMLDKLRKQHEFKLLPEETIDGSPVYVLEGKRKEESRDKDKTKLYIAKDTGIVLKKIRVDESNRNSSTTIFSDVKLNPKIDPGRFVFEAPPGVEIEDKTK